MNTGVLGGSFNPPHLGHLLMAFYALACSEIDRVIVVPCFEHPFGKDLIDFNHRFNMCRLAFSKFPNIVISDIERKLGGTSKTIKTMDALTEKYKGIGLSLIVGTDILPEMAKWYRINTLKKNYPLIIVPRGKKSHGIYIPDIKSRTIRKRFSKKQSVTGYISPLVHSYIKEKGLYLQND